MGYICPHGSVARHNYRCAKQSCILQGIAYETRPALQTRSRDLLLDPGLLAGRCKRPEYSIEGDLRRFPLLRKFALGKKSKCLP